MHRLAGLALIFLSLVHAAPQGIGAVICDSTAITDWQYKNSQPPQDVTNTFGDQGWENYDAILCTAAASSCSRSQGTTVIRTIGINFSVGGESNLETAIEGGLDFGVSVSWSTAKSESTVEQCPAGKDPKKPCVCGLQSKAFRERAVGTKTSTNECGKKISAPYDITAPKIVGAQGNAEVQWRICRSAESTCPEAVDQPACADGL